MDTRAYLHETVLHDCTGRVTHTLVLLLDGSVEIELADGRTARIDPTTRTNLTPRVPVPPAVLEQAAHLRPW